MVLFIIDVNIGNFHILVDMLAMKHAVCVVPLAPVRLLPDHRSEMTSQLLFGEYGIILEERTDGWILLQNHWDGYLGWCRVNQFTNQPAALQDNTVYTAGWSNEIKVNDQKMMLPFGCPLPLLNEVPGNKVDYHGEFFNPVDQEFNEANIQRFAAVFLNSPYLWGGKSVYGIDCSAFVQAVFRMMNIKLLRDAKLQVTQGEVVGFLQEAICGDLAFFEEGEEIMHVGILLNDHQIIHSSGIVRIDGIDSAGIVHSTTGKRTHALRIIKRI